MTAPAIAATLSDYLAETERMRHENRELRKLVVELLIWIIDREDLAAFARAEIDRRFHTVGARP